ncbi:hypothetical protein Tco_1050944 [Tanacetum coccineum]
MEAIHVQFDELTAMASECNNLEPGINCMNFQDSSEDSQSIPSKTDLDNLFGPIQTYANPMLDLILILTGSRSRFDTSYPMGWIRRIGAGPDIGECDRHGYAISSLMDMAYW